MFLAAPLKAFQDDHGLRGRMSATASRTSQGLDLQGLEAPGYQPRPRSGPGLGSCHAVLAGAGSPGAGSPWLWTSGPGWGEDDADSGPAQWWLEFGLGAPAGNRTQSLLVVLFAFFFSF